MEKKNLSDMVKQVEKRNNSELVNVVDMEVLHIPLCINVLVSL